MVRFPAGCRQEYRTRTNELVSILRLPDPLCVHWPEEGGSVPLLIAIVTDGKNPRHSSTVEDHTVIVSDSELTLARLRREEVRPMPVLEVVYQLSLSEGSVQRILGIFGFEEEADTLEYDCLVCCDAARSEVLLPCRHCAVCTSCLRSLRDERCPLCRTIFTAHISLPGREEVTT